MPDGGRCCYRDRSSRDEASVALPKLALSRRQRRPLWRKPISHLPHRRPFVTGSSLSHLSRKPVWQFLRQQLALPRPARRAHRATRIPTARLRQRPPSFSIPSKILPCPCPPFLREAA